MNSLILRWLLNTLALALAALFIPGIKIAGIVPALFAALVLGIVNAVIRPIIFVLTLPISLLTLGLFTLVINGFMLWMVSGLVRGFEVSGFGAAFFGALLISLFSTLFSWFVRDES
ncbi:phage holin family protein [Heliobacterium undosum]|uniref:Phage holin family protein n=1 Tax=Heliomicrobium undosum TaxID=121734 RepID=A0A845L443_9FIRM|nr:phage holin family protein [Heliomicrobium undosum]MZP29390.1 phage holin family protein [Heliomicrobium undosum]